LPPPKRAITPLVAGVVQNKAHRGVRQRSPHPVIDRPRKNLFMTLLKRRGLMLAFRLCLISALLSAFGFPAVAQNKNDLAIGTGFASGVYFPMGGGIAKVVSKYMPGYSAKVEVTGGSVDNLKLIATKRIDIGFSMADASWDAYKGADKFKSGKLGVRALMVLYPNSLHIVALERPDISKVSDLKGKRLATGAPGSATEVMALRVLEAYGIDKDITRERLGLEESVAALKDRKVDALFWSGGVPTAAIATLVSTPGIKVRLLDHEDAVDQMVKKYGPLYSKQEIAAKAYPGLSKSGKVAGVWNILVVSEDMSPGLAYNLVKSIFEHKSDMVEAHKEADNIALEYQRNDTSPIPFHPGAIRYFAEKGVKLK
jgi:TRAP transporter TAXI family solute receptor